MSVHDPKYLSLRRKLDQLKYPQTLHPDSVELVDRLVKDLFKSMSDLDKQRKKKQNDISDKNPTLTALYDQIDFLTSKNSQLSSEISQLRSQPNSKAQDKLRQFNTVLTDFKIQYGEKVNQYENTVQKLQQQISMYKQENGRLQKQCGLLKNSSSEHLQQLQENNVQLASMIQKKNKEIRQLQESNSTIRIKAQVLEKNLQEARITNSGAKEDNRIEGNRIIAVLKQEVADYQIRCKQARTELQLANNDADSLKRELQRVKDQVAYLRREQNQAKDMESINKVGKQKMETVFQQARDALTQKAEECRQLSNQILDHQQQKIRLNGKLSELTGKVKFLTVQNADLQSQIQLISAKATSHLKRTRELQNENAILQKQLGSGQTKDASLLIDQANAELRQQQTKNETLHRDMVLKERELKLLQNEVQLLRQQAEGAAGERQKKVLQNKKLQLVIAEGSKNLQIMQLQKEELMKENRQLKTGKQAIYSSDAASKSELFVLRQQLQNSQLQIDEIRALLKNQQNANRDLQAQISKLSGKLKQSQQKNRQVFDDNKLMVGQIKLLQQRKLQLYQKVKDLQQRQSTQQDNHIVTRKDFQQLQTKYGELERELAKKEQIVRVMDSQRDDLQNELDRETETRAGLQQQLAFLQQNSRQITKGIDQRQYSLNQMERRLSKAESARDSMERQFERQCEDVLQLKDRLSKAETAAREYENQANILALSNKEGQQEAQRLRGRVSQLDRKLKDKIRENDEDRERAMALNILSTELQGELQKQRMEVIRLQGFLKQLQQVNNSMFQHLQQKDQELQEQRYLIDESNRKQQALLHQISSYQRNLQIQTNDYHFLQQELQRSERQREAFRAERSWKKDVNDNAQDWKIKQEERVIQLQQDYDRKRIEVQQLRVRNRQLQGLLNQQRMRSFRNTQERTPLRTDLVQSRVQSYEGDIYNLPKRKQRMKSLSVRQNSELSQSESIQSSQEKMRMIQEMYKQTIRPSVK